MASGVDLVIEAMPPPFEDLVGQTVTLTGSGSSWSAEVALPHACPTCSQVNTTGATVTVSYTIDEAYPEGDVANFSVTDTVDTLSTDAPVTVVSDEPNGDEPPTRERVTAQSLGASGTLRWLLHEVPASDRLLLVAQFYISFANIAAGTSATVNIYDEAGTTLLRTILSDGPQVDLYGQIPNGTYQFHVVYTNPTFNTTKEKWETLTVGTAGTLSIILPLAAEF